MPDAVFFFFFETLEKAPHKIVTEWLFDFHKYDKQDMEVVLVK